MPYDNFTHVEYRYDVRASVAMTLSYPLQKSEQILSIYHILSLVLNSVKKFNNTGAFVKDCTMCILEYDKSYKVKSVNKHVTCPDVQCK